MPLDTPDKITWSDFSAGWCPSDDLINGRKNGLLVMDNVELDRNGCLSLSGGGKQLYTGFSANAHDLFSRYIGGTRYDYAALGDGSMWRNGAQLFTGGDAFNSCFGAAFDFVLIASGNIRYKDNGSSLVNLGVQTPSAAPVYLKTTFQQTASIPILANYVSVSGTPTTDGNYLKVTYATGGASPALANTAIIQSYNVSGIPLDWSVFPDGSTATDRDYINIDLKGFMTFPLPTNVSTLTLDILLVAPDGAGSQVSDYYSYTVDTSSVDVNFTGGPTGDSWNVHIRRNAFTRVGGSGATWSTVYGFRLTVGTNDTTRTFVEMYAHGDTTNPSGLCFVGGNASQDEGFWEFAQINVNDTGSYLAQSGLGPSTGIIPIQFGQAQLQLQTPIDTQVNQVWVAARSLPSVTGDAALENWYVIKQITDLSTLSSVTIDASVDDALTLNLQVNTNLVSIASSSISDQIISIIGPVNGRWFYFTTSFMYPSDLNDPDLVDTSTAIRISGSKAEQVLWACQISESTILVGTSVDIYLLTGTFAALPDNTLDVYYRPLGCKYPPFTRDVTAYNGLAYYYASDGWRSIDVNGNNIQITAPNIDRLYRNEVAQNTYSYLPGNVTFPPGSLRSPVTTAIGKLFACGVQTNRIDIYDFVRQYWRPYGQYNYFTPLAITTTQDGHILFYTQDNVMWDLCTYYDKQVNNKNQFIALLSPVFDGGTPTQRKELLTAKVKLYTSGTGSLSLFLVTETGVQLPVSTALVSNVLSDFQDGPIPQEIDIDLDALNNLGTTLYKTFQFFLYGSVEDLILDSITIFYQTRPEPLTYLRLLNSNLGVASPKRLRDWPLVVDTRGNDMNVVLYGDDVAVPPPDGSINPTFVINTTTKRTVHNYIVSDSFATDYGAVLYGGPFELYEVGQPNIVQVLPPPLMFDQVGPEELFKYGRVKQIELRVYPNGGTRIPFTLYANDNSTYTGTFTVVDKKEASYFFGVPKGTGAELVRIELGPTQFPFHRYYLRLQVLKSGRDTELDWVTLPVGSDNMIPWKQTP